MSEPNVIDGEAERRNITNRLRRLQGQLRGVAAMIDSGQECEAVLTQMMAARSALGQIGLHVIGHSMKLCLAEEPATDNDALVDRAFETYLSYRGLASSGPLQALDAPRTPESLAERLRAVEAQLSEVQADLDSSASCDRIVARIGEVTSALNEVALGVLGHSMRGCLSAQGDDRDAVIDQAIAVFMKYSACLK